MAENQTTQKPKVSEITNKELADYLRLTYEYLSEDEKLELNTMLSVAKKYIKSYTGLTFEQMEEHEDFVIVIYVLVGDMYDTRSMYVDKNNVNRVVETILGMHCINLL
ncbi:MAG TPA: phage gp6-like head-tail connector protein [Epulopiscium sp.]|nr:phage gp6-like head-tail connector protein [Candidatus Epulonipiscium sp.]